MYVRYVKGRAYLAKTERVDGRVVQRHLGPADPTFVLLAELRASERQERRRRDDDECQKDEELNEHWKNTRAAVRTALETAGYHNPGSRGWRRRRTPKTGE